MKKDVLKRYFNNKGIDDPYRCMDFYFERSTGRIHYINRFTHISFSSKEYSDLVDVLVEKENGSYKLPQLDGEHLYDFVLMRDFIAAGYPSDHFIYNDEQIAQGVEMWKATQKEVSHED